MTDLYKRTWFRAAALSVVAAALMVGCGKKEEPTTEAAAPDARQGRASENRIRLCRPCGRRRLDFCARQRSQSLGSRIRRQDQNLFHRERVRIC
jgi:hypothetical protein